MSNTTCNETEVPGFGSVAGCGRKLILHYYINDKEESDAAILCPHCDLYDRWPRKENT